jgi:hypothetical protein
LRVLGIAPLSLDWPPFGRTGFDSPRLHPFGRPASHREAGFSHRPDGVGVGVGVGQATIPTLPRVHPPETIETQSAAHFMPTRRAT